MLLDTHLVDKIDAMLFEPAAPVRECPLCPPWVECAHYGDLVISMSCRTRPNGHMCGLRRAWRVQGDWKIIGPIETRKFFDCPDCGARNTSVITSIHIGFDTEAEARAEFERRVAIMLGRDDDALD